MFAQYVKEISATIADMGPFETKLFSLQIAAIKRALGTRRLRWLSGMEYQLEEQENVYGEKTDSALMSEIIEESIRSEYYKALILEMLKEGPLSVREMAKKSGLKPYTISLRLNELEREGQAEFHSHVGSTAKFASPAA